MKGHLCGKIDKSIVQRRKVDKKCVKLKTQKYL